MKKNLISIAAVIIAVMALSSCASKDDVMVDASQIEGEWKVGAMYYEGHLIDVEDVPAIKQLYDTNIITVKEDGTFVYINKIWGERGPVKKLDETNEDTFLLDAEEGFKYVFEDGEFKQEPADEKQTIKKYIVTVLDENTIEVSEYDDAMQKASADADPFVYVKSGSDSEYIASNKANINLGQSSSSDNSSSGKNNTSTNNTEPFTNKYGTPTTKCAHAGCNNYIASSGDTNCCTTHSNKCLECGKYIDEDAMYCMDCLSKAADGKSSGSSSSTTNNETGGSSKCSFKENGVEVCNNPAEPGGYFCSYHKKMLDDAYNSLTGN